MERLLFKIMPMVIFAVWLMMVAAIMVVAYWAATIQPDQIGVFFGQIVHGFKSAA